MARAHLDALMVALGIGRKKCVILDLDGTAVAGRAGRDRRAVRLGRRRSAARSPSIGLYFGLHEALLALEAARHSAGLRQQERRGDRPRALDVPGALPARAPADPGRLRHLAGQLERQGREHPLDRRGVGLSAGSLRVHRRPPGRARPGAPAAAGGGGLGRGPVRPAPPAAHRSAPATSQADRGGRRAHRTSSRRSWSASGCAPRPSTRPTTAPR